eukprot:TRINITY_DN6112_c0_g1_i1.p1 TRINITY_DN6112_c0_g1~~TRINITY_DN6112_c0_g1_i1.p1  ORF type:complete len:550 (+),score=102.52 TRINITY_DN6112_c0_g1_i1:141-1790(+)
MEYLLLTSKTFNLRVEILRGGSGNETVVMIPIYNSNANYFLYQVVPLMQRYQVIIVHLPSIGRSEFDESLTTTASSVCNLIIDALQPLLNGKPFHLVSVSFGSVIGYQMALDFPSMLASATLVVPPVNITVGYEKHLASTFEKSVPHLHCTVLGQKLSSMTEFFHQVSRNAHDTFSSQEFLKHFRNMKKVNIRTLVVIGDEDPICTIEHGKKLINDLGEMATLRTIPGGHFLSIFNASLFDEALLDFLSDTHITPSLDKPPLTLLSSTRESEVTGDLNLNQETNNQKNITTTTKQLNSVWFDTPTSCNKKFRVFYFPFVGSVTLPSMLFSPHVEVMSILYPGRGRRSNEPTHKDIKSLARDIVENLPFDLPFIFLGSCLGSIVMYEVMMVLISKNKQTPFLFCPIACPAPHLYNISLQLQTNFDKFPTTSEEKQKFYEFVEGCGFGNFSRIKNTPQENTLLPILHSDIQMALLYNHQKQNPKIDVPIITFEGDHDTFTTTNKMNSWEAVTSQAFSTVHIQGDHFFIQDRTHAQTVSWAIEDALSSFTMS